MKEVINMNKKIAAIALSSVIAVTGLSALSAPTSAEWVKSGSSYSYKDDTTGKKLTGWQEIDGGKYYFNKEGKALTGWYKIGGKTYYFNSAKKGKMVTGTVKISGKTYTFGSDGVLKGETAAKKTTSSAAVKWGTSHDAIVKSAENSEMFLDLDMIVIAGSETRMKLYIFDEDAKLQGYADAVQGNKLSSYNKNLENKGYTSKGKVTEDGQTAYIYAKGDEIAATAYTKDDGQEMTMVMYFFPEFSKEMMSGDDIDMSEFSDFLS